MQIILTGMLSLAVLTSIPSTIEYKAEPQEELSIITMPDLVDYYAEKHGVDKARMNATVKCESSYNPSAVNWADSHKLSKGSHGIAQFSQQTFEHFAKEMGKDYTNPYNPREALDVMGYMIKNGHGNHWTCYRALESV